jgi:hypothetical protein
MSDQLTEVEPVKVGDFFYSSWGYDQTNVDFFEVLSLSASGKTAKVRRCQSAVVDESGPVTHVAPVPGSVHPWDGEVQTKRLRLVGYPGSQRWSFFVASYADAYLWDCRPKYETAAGWGH